MQVVFLNIQSNLFVWYSHFLLETQRDRDTRERERGETAAKGDSGRNIETVSRLLHKSGYM